MNWQMLANVPNADALDRDALSQGLVEFEELRDGLESMRAERETRYKNLHAVGIKWIPCDRSETLSVELSSRDEYNALPKARCPDRNRHCMLLQCVLLCCRGRVSG